VAGVTASSDDLAVYGGHEPARVGDLTVEEAGIAQARHRYGPASRQFFLWMTTNIEVSGLFIATIAASLGLGFTLGLVILLGGAVAGVLLFAWIVTWGPRAGVPQLALARFTFGRSVTLPAAAQGVTAGGWIALVCLFGAQATALLFGIPFWAGAVIVLAAVAAVAAGGYEWINQVEKYFALVMVGLAGALTYEIFWGSGHRLVLPVRTVHGGALAGAILVMIAVELSGSLSWIPYAMDFGRRMARDTPPRQVYWFTVTGTLIPASWAAVTGLAAYSILGSNQTADGIRHVVGGGAAGYVALAAIALGSVLSANMNAYSSALAFQAAGVPVKRPYLTVGISGLALLLVIWMQTGSVSAHFTEVILFADYWIAAFTPIIVIDWLRRRREYVTRDLTAAMALRNLPSGWPALAAFVLGFAAMIPFMASTLYTGPAATALWGGDLAYPVGFAVTGALYWTLTRRSAQPAAQPAAAAAAVP
jgi:NCS1 family nucleobase:cation symporter-1